MHTAPMNTFVMDVEGMMIDLPMICGSWNVMKRPAPMMLLDGTGTPAPSLLNGTPVPLMHPEATEDQRTNSKQIPE